MGAKGGRCGEKAGRKSTTPASASEDPLVAADSIGMGNSQQEGLAVWIEEYQRARPGVAELQEQIDQWMADFDQQQKQAKREREAKAEEDGWTLVTAKGSRKKSSDGKGVAMGAVSAAAVQHKAKKKAEAVVDFYRFQQRESRRNEILDLRQKFEEDKRKIAKLKADRKFRPY